MERRTLNTYVNADMDRHSRSGCWTWGKLSADDVWGSCRSQIDDLYASEGVSESVPVVGTLRRRILRGDYPRLSKERQDTAAPRR